MGATGSGKTSFVNMASGSALRVGSNLESCTEEVQLADEFTLDGQPVVLIDTPGFDPTNKSDTDILKLIAAFLATAYETGSTLAGVICIYRISDTRFTGISGRNLKMFRELCGDKSLKNVILATNMWGEVTRDVGEARENELTTNFFKPVLDKGARLARHHNTIKSAHDIIRSIMKNRPLPLQIQTELVTEGKNIIDTAAGEVINKELNGAMRCHQAELKPVQEEMVQALKDKVEETRRESEAETHKLQEQMNKIRFDSEGMAPNYRAHDTYYMDGRMVILLCGWRLFKVPYWHLKKYSPVLLRLAGSDTDETRGTSDNTAISIDDIVSVEQFVVFLDFFYRGALRKEIPIDEWCKLLTISSKLDCKELRTRAIDELTAKKTRVSSVDRIELGNKHNVPQWLPDGYADLFVRPSHLTVEEGKKLGLEVTVKVLEGRDTCKRNRWTSSSDDDVTQLVKKIFPRRSRLTPQESQGRNAGRTIYRYS